MKRASLLLVMLMFILAGCNVKGNDIKANDDRDKAEEATNILFDGDSICYGYSTNKSRAKIPYPTQVAERLQCKYVNQAVSGSCIAEGSKWDVQSVAARSKQTDYRNFTWIILQGGTNDYAQNIPLGLSNDTDEYTFYGALNNIVKRVKEGNPEANIVLVTPSYRNNFGNKTVNAYTYANKSGYTLSDYCVAMKEVAEQQNLLLFDSRFNSPISQENCSETTIDGLHFTQKSYIDYGNRIAEFIFSQNK